MEFQGLSFWAYFFVVDSKSEFLEYMVIPLESGQMLGQRDDKNH